jgi:hypothetical protein
MPDEITDPAPIEEPIVETPAPEPVDPEEPADPAAEPAPAEPEDETPPVRTDWRAEYFKGKQRGTIPPAQPQAEAPTPADELRSVIREELEPIAQSFAKSKDEEELRATFTKYPEAKKIEKTVRRYMENPAYAQVPVDFIARALLGAKEGAKSKADEEAKGTRQGGHTRRPTEAKTKSAWELSDTEFNKEVAKLMSSSTQ